LIFLKPSPGDEMENNFIKQASNKGILARSIHVKVLPQHNY